MEKGICLNINNDVYALADVDLLHLGITTAGRSLVEAEDVINTLEPGRLLDLLKASSG